MDKLDFLDGQEPDQAAAPEPQVEQVAAPTPEPVTDGPARGPDGKFAPKATEAPLAPEPAPAATPTPTQSQPEPGHIPLSALMDERDKRKAAEDRLRQLEAQRPQPTPPDRYEDPEGYEYYQAQQQQALVVNVRLDLSEEMARSKHGDDAVNAAQQWALEQYQSVPGFQQRVIGHRNPYEFVVQEYQRHQMVSQLSGDDFAQFQAWKAAQAAGQANTLTPAPAPAAPQPVAPPPSITSVPSAGGTQHTPSGPGQAFSAAFG